MQADAASIHTVAHSRSMLVSGVKKQVSGDHWMIANSVFSDFRMVHAPIECLEDSVVIGEDAARALRVQSGDKVRVVL